VSGASHELKNPLTSITSQLQVVLLKDRDSEEYRQIIKSILEDISNLNKTTVDLIEFARLNYENQIQVTDTRIDDVIWTCREHFAKTNPEYKIKIVFADMPEDENWLIVKGNAALLKIAFINLMDNACKFSGNKTCTIKLVARENLVDLSFSDTGSGIPQVQLPYIFEPFYRGNSTSETSGHGLGLALTRKIIQLHKAIISVDSQLKVGSTFSIRF
jgi:signal transduction histidine kinase